MKKTKWLVLAAALCCGLFTVQAQETNSEIKSALISFEQNVVSNQSIVVALYPSYAPDIVVNGKPDTFGFGLAALTDASIVPSLNDSSIAKHAFAGVRFDYLAHQAFASTVALGVKGNFQIKGHDFDVFAQTGANIPFSGFGLKNGEVGAMVGGGIHTTLLTFGSERPDGTKSGSLGLFLSAEKWTQFPGYVAHFGPAVNLSFK